MSGTSILPNYQIFSGLVLVLVACAITTANAFAQERHSTNSRYFIDNSGRAVFLCGSHTWASLQDWGTPTPKFDYASYLDLMTRHNHNFMRLWIWESSDGGTSTHNSITPLPWSRTGEGLAADGLRKFDLDRFDERFFERLHQRVQAARERRIYVSVMLFQQYFNWKTHPFAVMNNCNNVGASIAQDGDGREIHTLNHPDVLVRQEAFVLKVVDTLNDLDNVFYEIGNEFERHTLAWQYHMIDFIHECERGKLRQHPVGMTSTGRSGTASPLISNSELFASNADWISPHNEPGQNYVSNPPAATGEKVVIVDTDHLEGILGTRDPQAFRIWVWKCFTRGVHPIVMDAIQIGIPGWEKEGWNQPDNPAFAAAREAMGQVCSYSERLELAALIPHEELSSTGFCLANPGREYIVFSTIDEPFIVDLSATHGQFEIEWFNPRNGASIQQTAIAGGADRNFTSPWRQQETVLRLLRLEDSSAGSR